MNDPGLFTAQQASDPGSSGELLAAIAADRPDLRAYIAGNPAAYPALLEWLGGLGDPAVDAALHARSAPPTIPMAPYVPPAAAVSTAYLPPTSAPAPSAGYAPPGTEPYGQPAGAPYGQPAVAPYGAPGVGVPPKKNHTILWVVLAIVGVLVIGGAIAAIFVFKAINNAADSIEHGVTGGASSYGDDAHLDALWDSCSGGDMQACGHTTDGTKWCVDGASRPSATTGTEGAFAYGDNAQLDALWDSCASGDMQACDDLYLQSPTGSTYETFGDTCGNTTDGTTFCVPTGSATGTPGDTTNAFAYGDNAYFDGLWDACAAGDNQACDTLFRESPVGSAYETFGNTCGGRADGTTWCAQ
jgi:hypothetical protein